MAFTTLNAKENALRSHQKRKERAASLRLAVEETLATVQDPAEEYILRRLARIRVQLDQIDDRITNESAKESPDGQLLNWLCTAQERLSNQEFSLANRPKPAPLKMTARQSRQYQAPSSAPPPAASDSTQ